MRLRWLALSALFLSVLGCSGVVLWQTRQRAPQHRVPREVVVYVALSPLVASVDDGGNVVALVDGLERRLREAGKNVSVVTARANEAPPVPRIELQFQLANPGDMQMRGAGQVANLIGTPMGVGVMTIGDSSEVLVDVYAVSARGRATFAGRIKASNWASTTGYDATSASESAGREIGDELLR